MIPGGELAVDPPDEITAGVLVTHRGEVVHPAVRALLGQVSPVRTASAESVSAPALRRHRPASRVEPISVSTEKGQGA